MGSIPWSGRSPGGGQGNPFQYSCVENPMDRGAVTVVYSPQGCKELDITQQLNHPQQFKRLEVSRKQLGYKTKEQKGTLDERGSFWIHWKLGGNEAVRVDSISKEQSMERKGRLKMGLWQ